MEITINQVGNILKTLPIGYYTKNNNLEVSLTNTEDTYCNLMEDKINIGFKLIQESMRKVKKGTNKQLEGDIRCALYHEVGHAYVTPKSLMKAIKELDRGNGSVKTKVNIFEDERLETLLKDFFVNVNFKEFCKRVNDYDPTSVPKNGMSKFFELVRFRKGPREFLNRVHEIIMDFRNLHDDYWECKYYVKRILNLYEDYIGEDPYENPSEGSEVCFDKAPASLNGNETKKKNNELESESNSKEEKTDDEESTNESEDEIETLSELPTKGESETEENLKAESLTKKEIEKLNPYYNKTMEEKLALVLHEFNDHQKRTGSAINAYSGVFDPRSVVRDDYKFFVQKNRAGHNKAFSKLHLNLFIDVSGSFWNNEETVNSLLYSLARYEKKNPDFSFDLVTMSYSEELRNKSNRVIHCSGGNHLDNKVFGLMKKLQIPNSINYNIVLFDGDALSNGGDAKNFEAFSRRDTVVISDPENERYIRRYCTSGRTVLTHNYTKELIGNVLDALRIMAR